MKNLIKIFSFLFFVAILILPSFFIVAQDCQTVEECNQLLKELEEKISQCEKNIQKTATEKKNLQNQIYLLKQKIEKLNLQIQQSNVMIRDISLQIKDTQLSIEATSQKIEEKKNQIVEILRTLYQMDKKSLLEILITENSLSGFFDNLMYLQTLNAKTQELLTIVKNLKIKLEDQKMVLEKERTNLENVLKMQILQKEESESVKKEKEEITKLTEAQYQKLLKEKKEMEEEAAKIRKKLFELVGVSKAPTFGEAIEIAQAVAPLVGVRPAFLLAIISQESAIGRNVGQCYLSDPKTGDGIRISTGQKEIRTMNPQRDVPLFLSLTEKLGRDSYKTPVSCWIPIYINGKPFGWGGAMGPAQFIPSTWNLYETKIKEKLGRDPDPWKIQDSFLAAALYLADLGADDKTPQSEMKAANKYCGGYAWYASQVMKRADCIQNFIDRETMSEECQNLIGLR